MAVAEKQILTLTEAAAARIRTLVAASAEPVAGLRVGVSAKGCSGLSYDINYAREPRPFEEVVEQKGARVFVDPAAVMFLVGAEMDYVETRLESRFTFSNPNETARCGCGESFSVSPGAGGVS